MIEIKNITIKFPDKVIFENFSLTLDKNEIYCIVGKSGRGKSCLLRAICGLQKYSGEIIVNGKLIKKPSRDIGLVYQDYNNFPWLKVIDNVLFPIKIIRKPTKDDKDKAMEILKVFELENDYDKYPAQLSGGMKQRLALSSIIMQNPPVLLMDEPLSALDQETRENLQNFIIHFNNLNNQIIIVTHSMEEAEKLGKGDIIKL